VFSEEVNAFVFGDSKDEKCYLEQNPKYISAFKMMYMRNETQYCHGERIIQKEENSRKFCTMYVKKKEVKFYI